MASPTSPKTGAHGINPPDPIVCLPSGTVQHHHPLIPTSLFSTMATAPPGLSLPPPPSAAHFLNHLSIRNPHETHKFGFFQSQPSLQQDMSLYQHTMENERGKSELMNLKRERDGELQLPQSKRPIGE